MRIIIPLISVLLFISGCGGGSGGSPPTPTPTPSPTVGRLWYSSPEGLTATSTVRTLSVAVEPLTRAEASSLKVFVGGVECPRVGEEYTSSLQRLYVHVRPERPDGYTAFTHLPVTARYMSGGVAKDATNDGLHEFYWEY